MTATRRARPDEPLASWCELRLDPCTGRAQARHHRRPRSQGGTDEWENTHDLCDACHRHVHAHPAAAYTAGWLLHALPPRKAPLTP